MQVKTTRTSLASSRDWVSVHVLLSLIVSCRRLGNFETRSFPFQNFERQNLEQKARVRSYPAKWYHFPDEICITNCLIQYNIPNQSSCITVQLLMLDSSPIVLLCRTRLWPTYRNRLHQDLWLTASWTVISRLVVACCFVFYPWAGHWYGCCVW